MPMREQNICLEGILRVLFKKNCRTLIKLNIMKKTDKQVTIRQCLGVGRYAVPYS